MTPNVASPVDRNVVAPGAARAFSQVLLFDYSSLFTTRAKPRSNCAFDFLNFLSTQFFSFFRSSPFATFRLLDIQVCSCDKNAPSLLIIMGRELGELRRDGRRHLTNGRVIKDGRLIDELVRRISKKMCPSFVLRFDDDVTPKRALRLNLSWYRL